MAPPKYKLTYFGIRGRAEHLRIMFHYAQVPFEDNRINAEQWKELKSSTPFGQIPVLEMDGVMYEQSMVLARYLAKQFGLDGEDDLQRLKADIFVAHIEDLRNNLAPYFREQDPVKKEELMKKFQAEVIPSFFEKFEKIIANNGGFTAGKSVLWSDIILASIVEAFSLKKIMPEGAAEKFPHILKVKDAIFDTPQVKAYIAKRPHTDI